MTRAFISIGSNIDPETNVQAAVRLLNELLRVRAVSTVYLTEPLGLPDQQSYYNCVIEIETQIPPLELKQRILRSIESQLGRKRGNNKYAARTIDLDLILYDELMVATEELTIPDPDILQRPFLAVPLAELAPDLTVPNAGMRIDEAASALRQNTMKPLTDYTALIRKEILHASQR